ncbi:hypothetical protein KSP39_PZI017693 [Platanthera zijinensis]|uniref:Glucan endo-1,3-beta-D-glucosidase n=1 Tax=Platanthera zijinensis TaxID=2320716 RepID=A0AAP0B692_9ASPA
MRWNDCLQVLRNQTPSSGLKPKLLCRPSKAEVNCFFYFLSCMAGLRADRGKEVIDRSSAIAWVDANIVPYVKAVNFSYIDICNEVIPSELATFVLPAMHSNEAALCAVGISIPVTTAVSTALLGTSYPPSQEKIRLDYALFTASDVVVQDGIIGYSNLFDAMVDSVNLAIERLSGAGVCAVVSMTGWPSAGGGNAATIDNVRAYTNNLIRHVSEKTRTPKCPGNELESLSEANSSSNKNLVVGETFNKMRIRLWIERVDPVVDRVCRFGLRIEL